MDKLIRGVRDFQQWTYGDQQGLFQQLANGQQPEALFITCSDSRIDPNLLTKTKPGELFVLRNAGNIVPPYEAGFGAEAATIEYAVEALKIRQIVVCGHSHCGAMQGLLNLDSLDALPAVRGWLTHSEAALAEVEAKHPDAEGPALLNAAIKENVVAQLNNLRTHPTVAAAEAEGALALHGWVYQFETGDVYALDSQGEQFASLRGEADGFGLAHADLF